MIAIKDMEMPSCCGECNLTTCKGYDEPWNYACSVTLTDINLNDTKKPSDCPLVEIEEPEDCVNNYLTFKETLNALKKSFLSDKNSLWFLFGVWIGFVIISIFKFLILKE